MSRLACWIVVVGVGLIGCEEALLLAPDDLPGSTAPSPGPGGIGHYDEVTHLWCLDLVASNVDRVPGATGRAHGDPDATGELFDLMGPLCRCILGTGAEHFNAYYARDPSLKAMFENGAAGLVGQLISPTDFAGVYTDHLAVCEDQVDDAALRRWLYPDDGTAAECNVTSSGIEGNRLGRTALLEVLFSIEEGSFFGEPPFIYRPRYVDGCRGGGHIRYQCAPDGLVDAEVSRCALGCTDGCDDPKPNPAGRAPAEDSYDPVLSGPGCPPRQRHCEAGDGGVPELALPRCDGTLADLRPLTCGASATVFYYFSGWCPLCLQQLPALVDMFREELSDAGARLVLLVGRDAAYSPASSFYCEAITERYDLRDFEVLYDPRERFLEAVEASSGGGVMVVTDGTGRVRLQTTSGGGLDALRDTLSLILSQECAEARR